MKRHTQADESEEDTRRESSAAILGMIVFSFILSIGGAVISHILTDGGRGK